MRISNLLKLKEGVTYLVSQRMCSGDYYFWILGRYSINKESEYHRPENIFHGYIKEIGDTHFNTIGLFVDEEESEDYPHYKYLSLTGVAGKTFLSVQGYFNLYPFDFVGVYNKDSLAKDIQSYKLNNKISNKHGK